VPLVYTLVKISKKKMNKVIFTRKDLYDLVWSEPMLSLSKKYNISDVGLRKICIRISIPLPRACHWEKLRASKPVSIVPLPTEFDVEPIVTLSLRKEGDLRSRQENSVQELQEALRGDSKITLIVPERLSSPDKRIIAARESLTEKGRYIDKGLVNTLRDQIDIKVAPGNVGRALRFMDTLIKAVEARGYTLQIQNNTTYVVVDDTGEVREKCFLMKNGEICFPKYTASTSSSNTL
jgi:hypothetical protein